MQWKARLRVIGDMICGKTHETFRPDCWVNDWGWPFNCIHRLHFLYTYATVRNPLVGYIRHGTPEIPPVDGPRISWARFNTERDQEHWVKCLCESPRIKVYQGDSVKIQGLIWTAHEWRIIPSNLNFLLPGIPTGTDRNLWPNMSKWYQIIEKMPETCQVSGRSWMRFHAGSWSATSSHQQTLCQQRGRRVCLAALGWAPVLSTNSCRLRHVSSNYFNGDRDSQAGPEILNS